MNVESPQVEPWIDRNANLYEVDDGDPINNSDPSGLSATRSYLAGTDTTNFHSTKEVVVLPDGSRQITYRLFLTRQQVISPGEGAIPNVLNDEIEITNSQQVFSGPQAVQTEALADKAVATRVDSLNQIDEANARVDNMQFGFGFVPFLTAVDNYRQGKPWKLDAALSALALAPAIGAALKSALPAAAEGAGAIGASADGAAAQSNLVHLTDDAGLQGITKSGSVIGRKGIFAVLASVANQSTAAKVARTGLMPAQTAQSVPIPESAEGLFQQPIPLGPYSAWKYFGGVRFAPPGAINTASGEFTPVPSLIGPKALIYGPDVLFYGTAAGEGVYIATESAKR